MKHKSSETQGEKEKSTEYFNISFTVADKTSSQKNKDMEDLNLWTVT